MGNQLSKQDREAGLQGRTEGGKFVAVYDPSLALEILERIANGDLLKDILAEGTGMPSRRTWNRWVANDGKLAMALDAALRLSATAFEEEAISLGRQIRKGAKSGTQVRAFEVAMNQLRWSATRRDPQKYGERVAGKIVVPIQINTTMDLGGAQVSQGTAEHPNIYKIEASVEGPLVPPDPPKGRGKVKLKPLSPPKGSWTQQARGEAQDGE